MAQAAEHRSEGRATSSVAERLLRVWPSWVRSLRSSDPLKKLRDVWGRAPLSLRMLGIYAVLVAATLLFVAALSVRLTRNHLMEQLDSRLTAVVQAFTKGPASAVSKPEDLAVEGGRWLAAQAFPEDQVAVVRTNDGRFFATESNIDLRQVREAPLLLQSMRSRWWDVEGPEGPIRAISVPLNFEGRQAGTLVVAASRSRVDSTLSTLLSGIGWASAAGLVLSSLIGLLAVRSTLRPLRHMSDEVEAIQTTGDLSRRVDLQGSFDEVGKLAQAFDRMLARLQETFQNQQRFLADASHELRTPITVAKGRLELLPKDGIFDEEGRRSLTQAREELDLMSRIVDDLLLLARVNEGLELNREPVEVELVLREALLHGMQTPRETKVDVESGLYVVADPVRLLQVLRNLVSNAVQYAGEDGPLRLGARRMDGRVVIHVADNGPGIPAEDLPHVFKRFYRGSNAGDSSSGAGLGLAIAASLVEAMDGEIAVDSSPGTGTTFSVSLREAAPPS